MVIQKLDFSNFTFVIKTDPGFLYGLTHLYA